MLTGSLETFTSSEVLRLVAGTRRTGSLVVSGTGPLGSPIEVEVIVRDGEIVSAGGGSSVATSTPTALADMLRIREGEFSFDAASGLSSETSLASESAVAVEAAIAEAESILIEWQVLESYVPTLDAAVELTASIRGPVTLQPGQWTTLSAIGAGCTARDLARLTGEGPLDVCRSIRILVDLDVVRVHPVEDEALEPEQDFEVGDLPVEAEWDAMPASPAELTASPMGPNSSDLMPQAEVVVPIVSERFRHFSSRAAVAMAATEPAGAHLADLGDESVSRNVLLKFLASAR